MKIKVLGDGCYKCLELELLVGKTLQELGISLPVQRIDDPREMDRYLLGKPPGLVINEELVVEGHLPDKDEIRRWIADALSWEKRAWTP